jgi:hypothetical protein
MDETEKNLKRSILIKILQENSSYAIVKDLVQDLSPELKR